MGGPVLVSSGGGVGVWGYSRFGGDEFDVEWQTQNNQMYQDLGWNIVEANFGHLTKISV